MEQNLIDVWLLCSNGDGSVSGVFLIPINVLKENKIVKSILLKNANNDGDSICEEFEKADIDMYAFLEPFKIDRKESGVYNYKPDKYKIVKILMPAW